MNQKRYRIAASYGSGGKLFSSISDFGCLVLVFRQPPKA